MSLRCHICQRMIKGTWTDEPYCSCKEQLGDKAMTIPTFTDLNPQSETKQ